MLNIYSIILRLLLGIDILQITLKRYPDRCQIAAQKALGLIKYSVYCILL